MIALPSAIGLVRPAVTSGGTPRNAWRIYIDANDGAGTYCGMTELEMMTSVGGSDVTANDGRIFRSSAVNSENESYQAFDGNFTGTGWLSSGGTSNEFLGFHFTLFGAPPVAIVQFAITASWNVPTGSPRDFRLQWSNDMSSWTDARVVTGETGWGSGPPERRVFNV
jgi:hypothetical protein